MDTQHIKKKVRSLNIQADHRINDVEIEDVTHQESNLEGMNTEEIIKEHPTPAANAWNQRCNAMFEAMETGDDWYVADSDSEDVAEATREEDDTLDDDEEDPLCPSILFTAAENVSFRRVWRSALVVRGLGRRIPYLPLARRLNSLWAKQGPLQISDLRNGFFLVRFKCGEVDRATKKGARGKFARVC
ncbi:hypothetical protein LINGRAHAP2_LOCUS7412 [Linum grandiflorum]